MAQALQWESTRFLAVSGIGAGFQGGKQAVSVGYAKRIMPRISVSLSGAFSGSEKSAGVGFGVEL